MPIINPVMQSVFSPVIIDSWVPNLLFEASEQGVWYDPSDITTLFQDNAGTTPVTATGQSVGRILDKSGRGNHATQATLAQRPTYQVDGTGRPYLLFDGVDDWMATGTITPAINKAQVFAGIRKLSDVSAYGVIAETSASISSNNGSLVLHGPAGAGTATYEWQSKGTTRVVCAFGGTVTTAPVTNVLTGIADIAAPVSTFRINAGQVSTVVTTQGTGNYLAYPLYIGRRGGTTLPFNGRIYSLIIRFGANLSTGQIRSSESWVNGKTGAY
jgi:hypothetical protein